MEMRSCGRVPACGVNRCALAAIRVGVCDVCLSGVCAGDRNAITGLSPFVQAVAEPIVELGDRFDFVGGLFDVVLNACELDLAG